MVKKQKIFTIPNVLSMFRIMLIPLIVWLYSAKQAYGWALLVLILSGLTDIVDGFIARKWNMVSDLGKILDPIADKLTQFVTLCCLLCRFPHMWLPVCIMFVKEIVAGVTGLLAVKKSGEVKGADWHGKLCTVMLYSTIGLHILWSRIPLPLSKLMMVLSVAVMCLSGILYWYRNYKQIKGYV